MKIDDLVKTAVKENAEKLERFKHSSKKIKLGILGGTFDPIHYAHLATAEFIRDKYKLDKIIFIPSGNPPHKKSIVTDKKDRYNMVLLATESNDDFFVSDIEIKKEKRSYTVDTLEMLNQCYKDAELYFITGADAICGIEEWKDVKRNFELATFIAATRPGISLLKAQETIEKLIKKYDADIITVYVPSLDISSTYIRDQLEVGKSVRYLMPDSVEKYLYDKKIYSMEMSK
ncbi:nicotinate-nucleotide adenylyltransferase [Metaclostridioides mangenotii]|uniref:nicotinate-nucleotide adenylyltransferase n=1 Tax=Metaclostridioides mangenotii TaxID=1540 RepID=UPI00046492D6|nr:nicotinate-nucleotide adenylyltransferase [Clostridioides mangenotii]